MDVEVERPHAHHRSGHHWVDLIVPIAALFISFVSILIAYHHGQVMKELVDQNAKLVQANSLPYLQLASSNMSGTGWQLLAINSGVGPAKIRSVEIQVDGRPVTNPQELLAACCGGPGNIPGTTSTLLGRMLRAGDIITYLDLSSDTGIAEKLGTAYLNDRVVVTACYCSVFDECWTQSSAGAAAREPEPVKACPIPKRQYRH